MRIGTRRVASSEEMGLPRQKNGDEFAQSHGNAPGLVADPYELADPMTEVRVHRAEAFTQSIVPYISGGVDHHILGQTGCQASRRKTANPTIQDSPKHLGNAFGSTGVERERI